MSIVIILSIRLIYISLLLHSMFILLFFFNDTATTEIYTLSLHDALPIYVGPEVGDGRIALSGAIPNPTRLGTHVDRKSTRLNSSHMSISYAVFCLKKKNVN